MGNLISSKTAAIALDLDNSKPTPKEQKVFQELERLLETSKDLLKRIEDYKGCGDLARAAMSNPTPENERAAFEGLLVAVDHIAAFYYFSQNLERALPKLWASLCESEGKKTNLQDQQALAAQLARLFNFVFAFDTTRMMRPNLSNDFSYYRRLLGKYSRHPEVKVKDDEASSMALFTADHIPMLSCLSKGTRAAAEEDDHQADVNHILALIANSCCKMIKSKKCGSKPGSELLCARAMVGALVLYDLIQTRGGSVFKSKLDVRACVVCLKKDMSSSNDTAMLLNAIRYSTQPGHFATTPSSIQDMFE
eukprot:gb/GEZN01008975.1/.p1 GENE.gb/GEZN01008975.1/~~gb/GEZN01008975.1/.p1  ORF type:complete len:308 (-),score=37.34 gb/GEZN01008975.1/:330-1253(-)